MKPIRNEDITDELNRAIGHPMPLRDGILTTRDDSGNWFMYVVRETAYGAASDWFRCPSELGDTLESIHDNTTEGWQ